MECFCIPWWAFELIKGAGWVLVAFLGIMAVGMASKRRKG